MLCVENVYTNFDVFCNFVFVFELRPRTGQTYRETNGQTDGRVVTRNVACRTRIIQANIYSTI